MTEFMQHHTHNLRNRETIDLAHAVEVGVKGMFVLAIDTREHGLLEIDSTFLAFQFL